MSVILGLIAAGCAADGLSPANVASEPGGTLAVSFTRTFPPEFWEPGEHGYRMVLVCPAQNLGPPVVRFDVTADAPRHGTVYLRFDGPGRQPLSPADVPAVHPADTTIAVVTLAGMTESAAEAAQSDCDGSIVQDGSDAEPLEPGEPFSP